MVVTCVVAEDEVDLVGDAVDMVDQGEEDMVDVVDEDQPILILWLVTSAGCVAILPMTIPALGHSRLVVAILAPITKAHSNLGSQAQGKDVVEEGKSGLEG